MIQNIIFDFGNVFISLNTKKFRRRLLQHGLVSVPKELQKVWHLYEKGKITSQDFIQSIKKHTWFGNEKEIQISWESLIGDFPQENLELLQEVKQNYQVFLLSNINQIHEEYIQQQLGVAFYNQFIHSFKKVYFSHHIGMRKPELEIYQKVLVDSHLKPEQTLFVDDLAINTIAAEQLGIKTWNLNPKKETILHLPRILKDIK